MQFQKVVPSKRTAADIFSEIRGRARAMALDRADSGAGKLEAALATAQANSRSGTEPKPCASIESDIAYFLRTPEGRKLYDEYRAVAADQVIPVLEPRSKYYADIVAGAKKMQGNGESIAVAISKYVRTDQGQELYEKYRAAPPDPPKEEPPPTGPHTAREFAEMMLFDLAKRERVPIHKMGELIKRNPVAARMYEQIRDPDSVLSPAEYGAVLARRGVRR